jgi:hypothetical protein
VHWVPLSPGRSRTSPGPKNPGANYFYGGPDSAVSTGTQEISVAAGGVTTGKVHYTLAGWLGGSALRSHYRQLFRYVHDYFADSCTLVTAAELSQAVGVQYTAITDPGGNLCGVKGPGSASFNYTVQAESPANTWSEQVATIKGDDGQALSEPGIGDRAVWGGEEFAAEADGYIVGVIGADFPSTAQGSGFVRTGKIAKLLISKL